MVTKTIKVKGGEYVVEADGRLRPVATYFGLEKDAKPYDGVKNADRFMETNTGTVYIFDEEGQKWDSV